MAQIPRPAGALAWTLGAVAMHAGVPFALSQLGGDGMRRRGPGAGVRAIGLMTVAAGAAVMAWAFGAHYEAAPQGWTLEPRLTPGYLLRSGPYRLSRNPMYVGEVVVWLGWALFLDSPPVWAGLTVLYAALAKVARWEEQQLQERFGDAYREYVAAVPRWV